MIDITNKQSIYDSLTKVDGDNKAKFELAGTIHREIKKLIKTETQKTKKESLNLLTSSMTDDQLRARVKDHLISKLQEGTLQAAEIAQLKDIFGLASKTDELRVEVVDYKNAIIDCPHCGDNVHKPTVEAL